MPETVLLPPRLDAKAVEGLHRVLASINSNVCLDASQVIHIGTQCLQVILASKQTLQANGQTFRLENLSPECTEQLALFGLRDNFSTGVTV